VSADHAAVRTLLGGYLLGGLDELDQHRVDAHLRTCADCRAELLHLGPVPGLLRLLPPDREAKAPAPQVPLERVLHSVRATRSARRRRARRQWLAAAAALIVIVGLGTGYLATRKPASPVAPPVVATMTVPLVAAGSNATAGDAELTGKQWGVSVLVHLSSLPASGPFTLEIVGRDGHSEQAACWGPTKTARANVTGASSMALPTVGWIRVTGPTGTVLASAQLQ
jgi:anti-sigma factor RsiW